MNVAGSGGTNFFVMGVGVFAFAIGVQQSLDSTIGAALLALFGSDSSFPVCPVPSCSSLLGTYHVLAGQLQDGWRVYTMVTAGGGFVLTVWTAVAYQKDAANTGLVQRGLIIVYWSWIVALGTYLVTNVSSR